MSALMILVGLLFVVTAILSFAGWVWLVVRGFKTSAGWGLAMLFVAPIAAIVAAVKDWHSWKRPFLLYWGSFGVQMVLLVVCMGAGMALFASSAQGELAKAMEQAQQQAQNQAATDPGAAEPEGETGAAGVAASDASVRLDAPANDVAQHDARTDGETPAADPHKLVDPTGQPASGSVTDRSTRTLTVKGAAASDDEVTLPPGYEIVPVSTAASHAGAKVRLIDLDGRIHSGVLMGVENGALQVQFDLGAGSIVTGFEPKEIKALQVATKAN